MPTAAPQNADLSSAWMIPGVYLKLDLTGNGANLNNVAKRAVIIANKLAAGSAPQDAPILCTGQSDANTKAGRGSDLARAYAAFISEVGGGQADVYLLPIVEPSGGIAATRTITVGFSTGSTAAAQDSIDLFICGVKCSALVASGDTATTIGDSIATAINAQKDLPVTAANVSGTVTLTYRHKGAVGEDLPVIGNLANSASSNLTLSPGTLTYTNAATGAGSATVNVGSTAYSAAIANADTAATIATNVANAINAVAGPVTASASAGVVTLFFAPDRVVQRPSAAIVTTTGTTVAVAAGTAGSGAPTLTAALAVMAAQSSFGTWFTSFNDTASLGTLSNHIETYANGVYQKDQFLWAASTGTLASAGAIPSGTTPALTASGRYHLDWCQDAPQQAYELAARHAAEVCVQDFKPFNYDGTPLKSQTPTVPLMLPHRNSRPTVDSINSAMRTYNMTPLVVDEAAGTLNIVRGRNTLTSSDERQWDTSLLQTMAYQRFDMGVFLRLRFKSKSLKTSGTPHTVNVITVDDIADAIIERMFKYEDADFLDGADALKAAVRANVNVLSPTRVDAYIPCRPPVPMHVLSPVAGLV